MYKNDVSGIYKIVNTVTGDFYIGSSKHIKRRWLNHKCPSAWNRNPNIKLYQEFVKYGLNNFVFEVIEETSELKEREQYFIELLNPSYNEVNATGRDINKQKESNMRYEQSDKGRLTRRKYCNQTCSYGGVTLTLNALAKRFQRAGISHPTLEAKKYLI